MARRVTGNQASSGGGVTDHSALTGVTANQHHAEAHNHDTNSLIPDALDVQVGPFQLSADQAVVTLLTDADDWAPTGYATASVLRVTANDPPSYYIGGLQGGVDGRVVTIMNPRSGSNPVVLKNEKATSTAANRFAFGTDVTVRLGEAVTIWYDSTASRWNLMHPAITTQTILDHTTQADPHTGYRLETDDHTHASTGAQAGKIAQSASHESPDTDAATTSLHHTVGTGANQAAAGNHGHSSLLSSAVDIQTFTGNASTQTWNKPTGAKWVRVLMIGLGGAGGGGACNLNASVSGGGGGGGGGMIVEAELPASLLGSSENVVVPVAITGGLGGLAGQGSNQAGATPADPANVTFGDFVAVSGGSGGGGSTAKGNGGSGGGTIGVASTQGAHGTSVRIGAPGGDGSTGALAGLAGTDIPHNSTNYLRQGAGGGGGGGGRAATGGTVYAGGASGLWWNKAANAGAAGAAAGTGPNDGTAGTAMTKSYAAAQGGSGGGGGQGTGQAGKGGNGASYGGGGAGGGGAQSTTAAARAGQGGDGGPGIVVVTTFL